MSTSITWPVIGGSTYSVPAAAEENWPALSNYLIALAQAQGTTSQVTGIRVATTTPVTVISATDCVVQTNLSVAGAVAVNLPAGVTGQFFIIVDGKGDAGTNNITVTPNGAQTINGAASFVISRNRAGILISFVSSNWVVLSSFGFTTGQIVNADVSPTAAIAGTKIVQYTPGTSGAVPATGLPGVTSGAAVAAGNVGQVISTYYASAALISPAIGNAGIALSTAVANTRYLVYKSATVGDAVFITLTAGVWLIQGGYRFTDSANPITVGLVQYGLYNDPTASGFASVGSNLVSKADWSTPTTNGTDMSASMSITANFSGAAQPYYLYFFSQGTASASWQIAESWIRAIRIA